MIFPDWLIWILDNSEIIIKILAVIFIALIACKFVNLLWYNNHE